MGEGAGRKRVGREEEQVAGWDDAGGPEVEAHLKLREITGFLAGVLTST